MLCNTDGQCPNPNPAQPGAQAAASRTASSRRGRWSGCTWTWACCTAPSARALTLTLILHSPARRLRQAGLLHPEEAALRGAPGHGHAVQHRWRHAHGPPAPARAPGGQRARPCERAPAPGLLRAPGTAAPVSHCAMARAARPALAMPGATGPAGARARAAPCAAVGRGRRYRVRYSMAARRHASPRAAGKRVLGRAARCPLARRTCRRPHSPAARPWWAARARAGAGACSRAASTATCTACSASRPAPRRGATRAPLMQEWWHIACCENKGSARGCMCHGRPWTASGSGRPAPQPADT